MRAVIELCFCSVAARDDCLHGVGGVHAAQRLGTEHEAVRAVEDSVSDVGRLGARRPRRRNHGVDDARHDTRLADEVARRRHVLLDDSHLLWQAVEAEVATGEHDAVGRVEDGAEVVQRRPRVQFGDDAARIEAERVEQRACIDHILHGLPCPPRRGAVAQTCSAVHGPRGEVEPCRCKRIAAQGIYRYTQSLGRTWPERV